MRRSTSRTINTPLLGARPHTAISSPPNSEARLTDPAGDTSDGMRGQATGDNYTADRVAMIVAAIQALRANTIRELR